MDKVQSVDVVPNPYEIAQWASIVLSGDKGIPNEIIKTDEGNIFRLIQK